MAAGKRNPGSALHRATGADLELQAGAAFQLGNYPNHRKIQAQRLARLYGLPSQRASLLPYLVYGEVPK